MSNRAMLDRMLQHPTLREDLIREAVTSRLILDDEDGGGVEIDRAEIGRHME